MSFELQCSLIPVFLGIVGVVSGLNLKGKYNPL